MTTVITPVHDRPVTVPLITLWMQRQTAAFNWVIVDDGEKESPLRSLEDDENVYYVRARHPAAKGPTNAHNVLQGLDVAEKIDGGPVLYLEDDDWYGPDHVSSMVEAVRGFDAAAVSGLRHYHLGQSRYMDKRGDPRSVLKKQQSMGAFIVEGAQGFGCLRSACETCVENGTPFIDIEFWAQARSKRLKLKVFSCDSIVLMKGLPGRAITKKHESMAGKPDPGNAVLRSWVGNEAANLFLSAAADWRDKDRDEHLYRRRT